MMSDARDVERRIGDVLDRLRTVQPVDRPEYAPIGFFGEPAQDTWWDDEATVTSTHDVTPLRTNGFGCSMLRGRGYRRCPRKWH